MKFFSWDRGVDTIIGRKLEALTRTEQSNVLVEKKVFFENIIFVAVDPPTCTNYLKI